MIVGSALSSDIVMSVRDFVTYGLVVTSFFVLLVYAFPIYILFLVLLMMLMIFSVLYIAIVCRQVSSANRRLDPRKFNDLKQRYDQESAATNKERELTTIVARLLEQAKNEASSTEHGGQRFEERPAQTSSPTSGTNNPGKLL